eukprot:326590-Rhodomonas_salina.1
MMMGGSYPRDILWPEPHALEQHAPVGILARRLRACVAAPSDALCFRLMHTDTCSREARVWSNFLAAAAPTLSRVLGAVRARTRSRCALCLCELRCEVGLCSVLARARRRG